MDLPQSLQGVRHFPLASDARSPLTAAVRISKQCTVTLPMAISSIYAATVKLVLTTADRLPFIPLHTTLLAYMQLERAVV